MKPRATYTVHRDGPDRVTLRCTWCKRPSESLPEARVSRWKDAHVCNEGARRTTRPPEHAHAKHDETHL